MVILYIPKIKGRTKGIIPIISRMFQIKDFFIFLLLSIIIDFALFVKGGIVNTSRLTGSIDYVQTVGRGAARLERKGVSRSAERDLRRCLKNSRTFEKVRSKLHPF